MDDVIPTLSAAEARVLGSLIEKQISTPDYYPLTLNALTNACNQLTNREPVVAFDENTVVNAIDRLREKRLATLFSGAESRVAKYKHTLTDAVLLTPAEVALVCVLLLRGPQTVGELRTRTERLFRFDSVAEVEEALQALASRPGQPLVTKLPRQPGTKEPRYVQLFTGRPELPPAAEAAPADSAAPTPAADDRVAKLEAEVSALRAELTQLQETFAQFRKQFE